MTLGQFSKAIWREVAWIGREPATSWRQVAVASGLFALAYVAMLWVAEPLAWLLAPLASLFGQFAPAAFEALPWLLVLAGLVVAGALIVIVLRILTGLLPLLLALVVIGAALGLGIKLML